MTTPATLETPRTANRSIALLFGALVVTMLLASLSQTVLSSALPTIVGELHGVEHMTWVITAYLLASTIVMPVYGKISDSFGRKPILLAAIVLFVGGSVWGGLAQDMTALIVARVIQGLGGGGLMILSQAAIADVIPARDRGRYMGILGGVFAVSSVAGPLLGGWFTEGPGWRWAFWINIPLGIIAIVATALLLHLPKRAVTERRRIDYMGMATLGLATTAIVLIATWGGSQYAWNSVEIIVLIVAAVVFAALFVLIESKAAEPVMPLALFKDRNFNLTTIGALLTSIAMFGAIGYMPTYLQMATGASATEAGLLMIPMMGSVLVTSILTGQFVSKTGRYKALPVIGSVILAGGMWLLSSVKVDTPTYIICIAIGIIGVGLGASMQILTLVVQNSFPHRMVGTATASNNYFRQVGGSLGSAVVGSVFATRLTSLLSERLPASAEGGTHSLTPALVHELPEPIHTLIVTSYNEALMPVFIFMIPLAIAAAIVLLFVDEKPLATEIEDEIPAEALAEGQLAPMRANDSE
jgi:EmrB/QacA subfamily drug resistance transporter